MTSEGSSGTLAAVAAPAAESAFAGDVTVLAVFGSATEIVYQAKPSISISNPVLDS